MYKLKGFVLVEDINIYNKGILIRSPNTDNIFLKLWYLLFPRGWETKREAQKAKIEAEKQYGSKWRVVKV